MSVWTKRRQVALATIATLALGVASLAPTAAEAQVSVSIGVPGFWGYYAPPPPYYGYAYYGYPYGYAYYESPGPYYWRGPWRHAHYRHRHWRRWR